MVAEPQRIESGRPDGGAAGARLADLYEQHGRMVYSLCRLLLHDPQDAEDAAQQTFLSAHKSLLSGTDPRDPAAWLGTIARNECRARVERRMREPLSLDESLVVSAEGPEQEAARRADLAALVAALLELPDAQREAVVLREVCGLRYDEVSAALGVSVSAVESLIFRARRTLQERLGPLRTAAAGVAVPVAIREMLVQSVPGFAVGGSGVAATAAGGAGGAGLGALVAKLVGAPLAAKVAATTIAVGAAGTAVGVVETHRGDPPARRASAVAAAVVASQPLPATPPPSARPLATAPLPTRLAGSDDGAPTVAQTRPDRGADQRGKGSGGKREKPAAAVPVVDLDGEESEALEPARSGEDDDDSSGRDGGDAHEDDDRSGPSGTSGPGGGDDGKEDHEQQASGHDQAESGDSSGSSGSAGSSGSGSPGSSGSSGSGSPGSSQSAATTEPEEPEEPDDAADAGDSGASDGSGSGSSGDESDD